MERNELAVVIVLVLISMALGFGGYSVFFHPVTGEVRVRFKGGRQRVIRWLKTHARRIVLILVLAAAGIALLSLGVRYGGSIVRGVGALLSGWKSAAEARREPQTQRPAELDRSSAESMTPEIMPAEIEAPESTSPADSAPEGSAPAMTQPTGPAPQGSAPAATQPETPALEQPALQPAPPESEVDTP